MQIRDMIGRLSRIGGQRSMMRDARRLLVGAVATGRKGPGKLRDTIDRISDVERAVNAELATWLEPEVIATGARGVFDVCDLRVWLQQAEEAGIPHVPARPLLSVDHHDLGQIMQKIVIPRPIADRLSRALRDDMEGVPAPGAGDQEELAPADARARAVAMHEAMSRALDDIPASWMVRTHICGSSSLKAMVGAGLMLKGDDTAELGPDMRMGAGWVQKGNRRWIDYSDHRFVELSAQGHKEVTHYLGRPWAQPARFHEGEDLHRANSPLAGPGKWPAEWRVFVRNGQVTGVSNYYGWAGSGPTPENAWNALEAAGMAQQLADHMVARGLRGEYMDTVLLRAAEGDHPDVADALRAWEAGGFHATIDFIEAVDGMMLLEAGPAHAPGGGGHPCAFAGQNMDRADPARCVASCEGVAFLPMAHVHLGEPSTWRAGDPSGAILAWDAVIELAAAHQPISGYGERYCDLLRAQEVLQVTAASEPLELS